MVAKKTEEEKIEEKTETVRTEKVTKIKLTKKDVKRDFEVGIMNNIDGDLLLQDRNNVVYTLPNYGDMEYFSVNDLLYIKNNQKATINNGWGLIIDDEFDGAVVDYLGLTNTYKQIYTKEKLVKLLKSKNGIDKLNKLLQEINKGLGLHITELIVSMAKENYPEIESSIIRKIFIDYTQKQNLFDF